VDQVIKPQHANIHEALKVANTVTKSATTVDWMAGCLTGFCWN